MVILSADTSSNLLSFTIAYPCSGGDHCVVDTVCEDTGGKTNELFFSIFSAFLDKNNMKASDIDKWVVVTGPGSFTGIRIGIAALTGITSGLSKKLYGITAFDAAALLAAKDVVDIAIQLKLNEFALKKYNFIGKNYSDVTVVDFKELPENCLIVNSGDKSNFVEPLSYVIALNEAEQFFTTSDPFYVRKSEAELNFDKRSKQN